MAFRDNRRPGVDVPHGGQEPILRGVVPIVRVSEDRSRNPAGLGGVPLHQLAERVEIAGPGPGR